MSCALVVGSALEKECVKDKKVGIIMHQKTSDLQTALFNNVLGLQPGTKGMDVLKQGPKQLEDLYPKVVAQMGEPDMATPIALTMSYPSQSTM